MIKAILHERTVAVCASMDFAKGLGRSEPWDDSRWSRWRKEIVFWLHRILFHYVTFDLDLNFGSVIDFLFGF